MAKIEILEIQLNQVIEYEVANCPTFYYFIAILLPQWFSDKMAGYYTRKAVKKYNRYIEMRKIYTKYL